MPSPEVASKERPRFNCLAVADLIAAGGIVAIACRPDGLAITVSAVIVTFGALLCRCVVGTGRAGSGAAQRPAQPAPDLDRKRMAPVRNNPAPAPVPRRPDRSSWLRDGD